VKEGRGVIPGPFFISNWRCSETSKQKTTAARARPAPPLSGEKKVTVEELPFSASC
jgi:hypothetical protein